MSYLVKSNTVLLIYGKNDTPALVILFYKLQQFQLIFIVQLYIQVQHHL